MRFEIQRFADEGAPENSPNNEGAEQGQSQGQNLSQGNADSSNQDDELQRKVDAAIAKAQAKLEADFKKRAELEKKEAERLSKLSDDERAKVELEKAHKELEDQKAKFEREKLKYETAQVLSKRGIPAEFTDYLIDSDNESTLERIKVFEKHFNKAVEDAVNARLKGTTPKSGGKSVDSSNGQGVSNGFMDAILKNQIKR